jgi:hypothetical protein
MISRKMTPIYAQLVILAVFLLLSQCNAVNAKKKDKITHEVNAQVLRRCIIGVSSWYHFRLLHCEETLLVYLVVMFLNIFSGVL